MSGNKRVFVVVAGIAVITLVLRWTDSFSTSPTLEVLDQSEFGCPIRETVTRVPYIERDPGGKYLDFVCKAK